MTSYSHKIGAGSKRKGDVEGHFSSKGGGEPGGLKAKKQRQGGRATAGSGYRSSGETQLFGRDALAPKKALYRANGVEVPHRIRPEQGPSAGVSGGGGHSGGQAGTASGGGDGSEEPEAFDFFSMAGIQPDVSILSLTETDNDSGFQMLLASEDEVGFLRDQFGTQERVLDPRPSNAGAALGMLNPQHSAGESDGPKEGDARGGSARSLSPIELGSPSAIGSWEEDFPGPYPDAESRDMLSVIPSLDAVEVIKKLVEKHETDLRWMRDRLMSHHRNMICVRYLAEKAMQASSRGLYIQGKGDQYLKMQGRVAGGERGGEGMAENLD